MESLHYGEVYLLITFANQSACLASLKIISFRVSIDSNSLKITSNLSIRVAFQYIADSLRQRIHFQSITHLFRYSYINSNQTYALNNEIRESKMTRTSFFVVFINNCYKFNMC